MKMMNFPKKDRGCSHVPHHQDCIYLWVAHTHNYRNPNSLIKVQVAKLSHSAQWPNMYNRRENKQGCHGTGSIAYLEAEIRSPLHCKWFICKTPHSIIRITQLAFVCNLMF